MALIKKMLEKRLPDCCIFPSCFKYSFVKESRKHWCLSIVRRRETQQHNLWEARRLYIGRVSSAHCTTCFCSWKRLERIPYCVFCKRSHERMAWMLLSVSRVQDSINEARMWGRLIKYETDNHRLYKHLWWYIPATKDYTKDHQQMAARVEK